MSDEPRITEADLHAYADGRVDDGRRAEIEAWLAERPDEAERVATWKRVGEGLRALYDPVLEEAVPEELARAARGTPRSSRAHWRGVALAATWAVLGAAIGAVAGWQLHGARVPAAAVPDITSSMPKRAAVAH